MVDKLSSSHNEIIQLIETLLRKNSWLKVTKSYRGIILSDAVKIISVDRHRAAFQAFDNKICAACESCAYLHNPTFPRPVKAQIKDTCIGEGIFTLTDFTYQGTNWKDRRHDRVQPMQPTYGTLINKDSRYRVPIKNVSLNGMGLSVSRLADQNSEMKPDSEVKLDFHITSDFNWTSLRGRIVYLIEVSKSLLKLGVELQPKAHQAQKLEEYISLRKKEIMNELEHAFFSAMTPMGVEGQYF